MVGKFKTMLAILLLTNFGCHSQQVAENKLGNFDMSKDDRAVLFSYYKNDSSSIYIKDLGSHETRLLIKSSDISYVNPKFSPSGDTIVFIGYKIGNFLNSAIYIADVNGRNIKKLTDDNYIITEATFSSDGKSIYFCQAKAYEKYSPIGRKNAHDFDIFKVDIRDKTVERISNMSAYSIYHLSDFNDEYVLIYMFDSTNSGIYLLSKKDASLKRIAPLNNPRKDESLYSNPTYSANLNLLIFTAPYEIYAMSLTDSLAHLIVDLKGKSHVSSVRLYNTQPRILFSQVKSQEIISTNIDGSDKFVISLFK